MKSLLVIVACLLVAAGLAWGGYTWYQHLAAAGVPHYRTVAVGRGDMHATIGATGTLEPETVVDVGAQVSGLITSFGEDPHAPGKPVDYNSKVEADTVLAKIDEALPKLDVATAKAQMAQAKASLAQAKAGLLQAQATVLEKQATLVLAGNNWERAQKIGPSDALSQNDYDNYRATYEVAKADVAVSQAAVDQTQANIAAAQATIEADQVSVDRAQRNLDYCTIRSPVKGVVVDRRVNIGQTVASSLNTPSLFLIAQDLSRMEIWVSVNEADIGQIRVGQKVTFTVDARPGRGFEGHVRQVRLNASTTQNVVTYPVVVAADNKDGALLPYQTTNVLFDVADHTDVLLVPNAALRWSPSLLQIAPDARQSLAPSKGARPGKGGGAGDEAATQPATAPATTMASNASPRARGIVWVKDGAYVRPIVLRVGLSDGTYTEVLSSRQTKLEEGTQIVTGELHPDEVATGATNPFVPQFGQRR